MDSQEKAKNDIDKEKFKNIIYGLNTVFLDKINNKNPSPADLVTLDKFKEEYKDVKDVVTDSIEFDDSEPISKKTDALLSLPKEDFNAELERIKSKFLKEKEAIDEVIKFLSGTEGESYLRDKEDVTSKPLKKWGLSTKLLDSIQKRFKRIESTTPLPTPPSSLHNDVKEIDNYYGDNVASYNPMHFMPPPPPSTADNPPPPPPVDSDEIFKDTIEPESDKIVNDTTSMPPPPPEDTAIHILEKTNKELDEAITSINKIINDEDFDKDLLNTILLTDTEASEISAAIQGLIPPSTLDTQVENTEAADKTLLESISKILINNPETVDKTILESISKLLYKNPEAVDSTMLESISKLLIKNPEAADTTVLDSISKLLSQKSTAADTTVLESISKLLTEKPQLDTAVLDFITKLLTQKPQLDTVVLESITKLLTQKPQLDTAVLDSITKLLTENPQLDTAVLDSITKLLTQKPQLDTAVLDSITKLLTQKPQLDNAVLDSITKLLITKPKNSLEKLIKLSLEIIKQEKHKEHKLVTLATDIVKTEKHNEKTLVNLATDIVNKENKKDQTLVSLALNMVKEIVKQKKEAQPVQELVIQKMAQQALKTSKNVLGNLKSIFKNKVNRLLNIPTPLPEFTLTDDVFKTTILTSMLSPPSELQQSENLKSMVLLSKLSSKALMRQKPETTTNDKLKSLLLVSKLGEPPVSTDALKQLLLFISLEKEEGPKQINVHRVELIKNLKVIISIIALYNTIMGEQLLTSDDTSKLISDILASLSKESLPDKLLMEVPYESKAEEKKESKPEEITTVEREEPKEEITKTNIDIPPAKDKLPSMETHDVHISKTIDNKAKAEETLPTTASEEKKQEVPVAEEKKTEVPVAEEKKTEVPVAEEKKPEEKNTEVPVAEKPLHGGASDKIARNNKDFIRRFYSNIIKVLQPISVADEPIKLKLKTYISNFITYCMNNNKSLSYNPIETEEKLLYIERELQSLPKKGETSDEDIGKNIELYRNEPKEKSTELTTTSNCDSPLENEKLIGKVGNKCLYYDITTNKVREIETI